MKQVIYSNKAPAPIGPYSQAILANGFVFLSGQIPVDETGDVVASDISSQTRQVLKNIQVILEQAGSSLDNVVKMTVYLKSIKDFGFMNDVYGSSFLDTPPARSTVEVSKLPKDVLIEIDCIATI